jgi:hypothetical protein
LRLRCAGTVPNVTVPLPMGCFSDNRTVPRRCVTPLGRQTAAPFSFRNMLLPGPRDAGDRKLGVALGAGALGQRGFEAFDEDQADAACQRARGQCGGAQTPNKPAGNDPHQGR